MIKKAYALAAGAAVAMVLALVPGSPASAHDITLAGPVFCPPLGLHSCGYGGVYQNHTWVFACDTNPDGKGYAITYQLRSGSGGSVPDSNGSAAGCGSRQVGTASNPVVLFQLCSTTLHACTDPFPA